MEDIYKKMTMPKMLKENLTNNNIHFWVFVVFFFWKILMVGNKWFDPILKSFLLLEEI